MDFSCTVLTLNKFLVVVKYLASSTPCMQIHGNWLKYEIAYSQLINGTILWKKTTTMTIA